MPNVKVPRRLRGEPAHDLTHLGVRESQVERRVCSGLGGGGFGGFGSLDLELSDEVLGGAEGGFEGGDVGEPAGGFHLAGVL